MQTLAPNSFCSLTDPQPYQRDRDKPRQGVVANTLNSFRNGAVGFIGWLDATGDQYRAASSVGLNMTGTVTLETVPGLHRHFCKA